MELIRAKAPDHRWLKAAVVGSYWAAIEIVIGSFLHNLKVPFSGAILSSISVFLLVLFVSEWRQKGLVIRAGLISALLKSISPSAIILGPMIGILSEAVLLELAMLLLGRNLLGYITGGALAVFSTLLHKVVSLLIVYGFNLVKILEALYYFVVKQVGIKNLEPEKLLVLITIIYLAAGALAALAGYLTSARLVVNQDRKDSGSGILLRSESSLFDKKNERGYSLWLLLLNISAVTGSLYLVNVAALWISVPAVALYFGFVLYRYPNSTRHLKKSGFWIQFFMITLIAAFLLNGLTKGQYFSLEGLKIGLYMNLRAAIILVGFSAISTELKNPVIKAVTMQRGMAELYHSVNLAFSALPAIFQMFPGTREFFRRPAKAFSGLFYHSSELLATFERQIENRPDIIIITGDRQQGKTTFVRKIIDRLRADNLQFTGFLAEGINEDGNRIGFDLLNLQTGAKTLLCRSTGLEGVKFGRFIFSEEGLRAGAEIISSGQVSGSQLVIIDEIGPLELNRQGWWQAVTKLVESAGIPQLWVVRKNLVKAVISNWKVGDVYVFDIQQDQPADVVVVIHDLVKNVPDRS